MGKITIRYEDWSYGVDGRLTIFEEELEDNFTYDELRDHRIDKAKELLSKEEFSDISEIRTSTSATGFDSGSYVNRSSLKPEPEKYYDKNNNLIKEGMTIRHDNGDEEYVYLSASGLDLGVNASNENHISFDEFNRQIYPLHQFDLSEWEIVDEKK